MTICPIQHQRLGLTPDNHNKSPSALPPVPPEGQLTPTMMWLQSSPRVSETWVSSDSCSSRGSSMDSNLDTASMDCLSYSDTGEILMRIADKMFVNHSPACWCRWSWNTDQSAGQVAQKVQVEEARRIFLKPSAVNLGGWQYTWELPSEAANELGSVYSSESLGFMYDPPNFCIFLFAVPSINSQSYCPMRHYNLRFNKS